jgi:hypothetical protein
MALQIWDVNPDAYVILEHLAENSEEKNLAEFGMLLWGNMNHEYAEASMGYSSDIDWASYKERNWSVPNVVAYMESHDEERLMYKNLQWGNSGDYYNIKDLHTGLHRIELAANFFIPIPGPKMIWQFGELGYDYSIDYDCRVCNKPIKWDYFTSNKKRLYYVFKALNNLKTTYDVFSTSDYTISQIGRTKSIHLFDDEMDVVILGNFDIETQDVNPEFPQTGNWFEYYTGETLSVVSVDDSISLLAGEYRLYTSVKLNQPNIPLKINNVKGNFYNELNVYPNPSSDIFFFNISGKSKGESTLYLYNIQGQLMYEKQNLNQDIIELDATELEMGVYFYKLITDDKVYTGKVLKN